MAATSTTTETETLQDLLQREHAQIQAASLSIPHQFSSCTYYLGYIRQPVHFCKTCATPRGFCAACSVACHHDHEQVELFPKRAFRCDCPTKAYSHPCCLVKGDGQKKEVNAENRYNQNFRDGAKFCRCGRDYDPMNETETMIQCLACEDWFHETCLNLREKNADPEAQPVEVEQDVPAEDDDDVDSDTDPSRPPPRLLASEYDALVCRDCVLKMPILRKLAGTPGLMMLVLKRENAQWEVIGRLPVSSEEDAQTDGTGAKRKQPDTSEVTDESQPKKAVKLENGRGHANVTCRNPPSNVIAQQIVQAVQTTPTSEQKSEYDGAGDVFLAPDFRTKWCQCSDCAGQLSMYRFLLEEEETYEPPDDPDSGLSFEELGMRALQMLPRDKAIDGIMAYNTFRDELLAYLRPFAQSGQAVSKDDIQRFFGRKKAELEEASRARAREL